MPTMEIDGLNIYYELHGEGETIVLLHNGFSSAMMWEAIAPRLVAAGYRVLMYDRCGFGRSAEGPDFAAHYVDGRYRQRCVAELDDLLADVSVDRFHMVGQCEGGVVGVDFAVRYPDRVRTLTTASTMCHSVIPMETFNKEKLPANFNALSVELQKKYNRWHGADRGRRFYDTCAKGGGCYGQTGYFDLRPALAQVTCPTLIMYPDRGYFFDVEQGLSFYRHMADGELLVFPRCGHNIFEHYPQMYVRQVIDFIGRHAAGC